MIIIIRGDSQRFSVFFFSFDTQFSIGCRWCPSPVVYVVYGLVLLATASISAMDRGGAKTVVEAIGIF